MASPLHAPHPRVRNEVANANRPRSLARASDKPAQARRKHFDTARLADEVDRTATQRCEFVLDVATPRQKDDRTGDLALTQCAQHFKPRHRRHRPVQQHEVYGQPRHCIFEEGLAVAKFVHGEAVTNQQLGRPSRDKAGRRRPGQWEQERLPRRPSWRTGPMVGRACAIRQDERRWGPLREFLARTSRKMQERSLDGLLLRPPAELGE